MWLRVLRLWVGLFCLFCRYTQYFQMLKFMRFVMFLFRDLVSHPYVAVGATYKFNLLLLLLLAGYPLRGKSSVTHNAAIITHYKCMGHVIIPKQIFFKPSRYKLSLSVFLLVAFSPFCINLSLFRLSPFWLSYGDKKLAGTNWDTCERKEWLLIRTVWDISRDDRARTEACSLQTATDRSKEIISIIITCHGWSECVFRGPGAPPSRTRPQDEVHLCVRGDVRQY